ncbi:L-threonylcarbamoyladenylate synthase [Thalassospiraceae bacterium LMO-JJ14]|nr:L-threonylcarbamoyladenylate synthase [Thalassospiraceae bacterium LMO-JJ14]
MTAKTPIRAMDDAAIEDAARIIRAGGLVAFATETVYGLGGDATNADAVARIFAAKGRPTFNPLISHVADMNGVKAIAVVDERATLLADAFWPGPLTLVLNKRDDAGIAALTTAGLSTIAVRIPARPRARQFLEACGVPVAAPSANASGAVSPSRAVHVAASLPGPEDGGPEIILDDGPCEVGLESTVVDLSTATPTLLRPGGLSKEDIESVIGPLAMAGSDDHAPKSPGMMSRHYAPKAKLRMNALSAESGEVFVGFGTTGTPGGYNLSPDGDLTQAAANLFQMLHALDEGNAEAIAVAPIPQSGLGLAINDRLRRAVRS